MKKISYLLLLALALSLCLWAFATGGQLSLTLEPTATTVGSGETFEVTVSVAENPGFLQAEFSLQYDASALQVESVSTQLCAFPADTVSVNTETAGTIRVNVAAMSEVEGEHTGTGRVFKVSFRVTEGFTGDVTLSTVTTLTVSEGEAVIQEASCVVTAQAATEHVHTEETIPMIPATCTEQGWTEGVRCSECGAVLQEPQAIAPNGHIPGPSVVENHVLPNCQADGSYDLVVYCTICQEEISRETVVDPSTGEHSYTIEQERQDATCTDAGYVIRACVCGATEQEELPATGHKEVADPGFPPDCTEEGLTDGSHCEICGQVLQEQQTIPAAGHMPGETVRENEIPVSCQTNGSYEAVVYCDICNQEISRQTVEIATTGEHNFVTEQGRVEPTCTEEGSVTYACGCGLTQDTVLPATGHTEVVDAGFAPTCTEPGLSDGSHCQVCGVTVKAQEELPAAGHSEKVLQGYAATCTEPGLTDGMYCEVCYYITVPQEQTPLAEHSEELVPGYAPTCTEVGMTDSTACAFCGLEMSAAQEIPATGHTPVQVDAKDPTCSKAGHTAGTKCSVCDAVISGCQTVQKLPHTEVVLPAKEPTCADFGMTEGRYCSVCGEVTLKQVAVAKLDHTPETVAAIAPTCSAYGWTEGEKCAACGEVLTDQQQIPKLSHTEVVLEGVEATCTATGLTQGSGCSECGAVIRPQEVIPVAEHQYDFGCDPDCNVCGSAKVSLEHQFGHWVTIREATEDAQGEQTRSCVHCGQKQSRTLSPIITPRDNRTLVIIVGYVAMAGAVAGIYLFLRKQRMA